MTTFRYSPEIVARYPHVVGGVILASGLRNGPTDAALRAAYQAEQEATIQLMSVSQRFRQVGSVIHDS